MKILLLAFFITISSTYGRGPAVEDFVTVEPESYRPLNKQKAYPYKFKVQTNVYKAQNIKNLTTNDLLPPLVLISFFLLPFLIYMGIKRVDHQNREQQSLYASKSEVESLNEDTQEAEIISIDEKREQKKKAS